MPTDSFKSYPLQFILLFKEEKKKKTSLERYSKKTCRILYLQEDSKKIDLWTEANELSMAPSSDLEGLLKKMNIFKEVNAITISLSRSKWYYQ